MFSFESYLSPFSWRYGSSEMRAVWSEVNKRRLWRRIWVALARIEMQFGLVTADQVDEMDQAVSAVDMEWSLHLEAEIHHDLMAELKVFAVQSPLAGGIIHLGATSMDIEDNADAIRLRQSVDLILGGLEELLRTFAKKIEQYAAQPVMAYTHLQPAEPTTLGYRLSLYAQDLLHDWQDLRRLRAEIRGKGFKGAVGTAAGYADLIGEDKITDFENRLTQLLDLPFYSISSQTYPRRQDFILISALAAVAASLSKFALDLRFLQSPAVGEVSEPFSAKQVGSSAMPFKRNPIMAEKIDSLARQLSVNPQIAWQNAANSILERTLDDSANRRTLLPESFLICDELLITAQKLLDGLQVHTEVMQANLDRYAPFASTERIMMLASKRGADRQEMHELLREHTLTAWKDLQNGKQNPLINALKNDTRITRYLSPQEIDQLLKVDGYTGKAKQWALQMSARIFGELKCPPL